MSAGNQLKRVSNAQVLAAIVGACIAVFLVGFSSIWPTNTSWLRSGDSAAGQIAWNYFRQTSLSQWPPTLIPNYGVGWSTYFTGAGGNVLIGLPLKYLNFLLPNEFQYVGIWTVACFALQGYFAAKILSLYSSSKVLVVLLSTNFIIAPIFVFRIGMMSHAQLGAQWILLCAIYFFLNQNQKVWQWVVLVSVSHLVELYMSAMVLAIIVAFFLSQVVSSKSRHEVVGSVKILVASLLTSSILLWVLGFFSLPEGLKGNGFFRFSATTLMDPRISGVSSASLVFNSFNHLPNRFTDSFDGESFLYLGIGFIVLSVFFLGSTWRRIARICQTPRIWLLLVCFGLFLIGLSRTVSIGPFEFTYWWPSFLEDLRQTFRAATRFGWPLYYLIYTAVSVRIIGLSCSLNKKLIITGTLLLVNVVDLSPLYFSTAVFYREEVENSIFTTNKVEKVFENYSSINFVPVFDLQEDVSTSNQSEMLWRNGAAFYEILLISSKYNLKSNLAYESRSVGTIIESENAELNRRLNAGSIDRGVLYVFKSFEETVTFSKNFADDVVFFSFGENYFIGLPR